MEVATSIRQKTLHQQHRSMAGWVATRSAVGSLGTRTQAVVSLIALRLRQPAPVYISKAYYSSPGAGDGSNSSLNAEYVVIGNANALSHSHPS